MEMAVVGVTRTESFGSMVESAVESVDGDGDGER
jgi:hypothetical protein